MTDAQKLVNEPAPQDVQNQEEEDNQIEKRSNPVSKADIESELNAASQQYEAKGLHHESLILRESFDLNEHTITIRITNEALEGTFDRMRTDLLEKLRDQLKNDHLQLRSEIIEPEKKDMLYTDKEKFEHLKKKYPALKDLQERLGLDPEF